MKEIQFIDLLLILYRRKLGILFLAIVAVCTSVVLSKMMKPVYEASAVFYIPSTFASFSFLSDQTVDNLARDALLPRAKEDDFGPFLGMLKSRRLAELVHGEFPSKSIAKLRRSDVDFELSNEFMLKIYSRDRNPVLAADVANAYIKYLNVFLQEVSSLSIGRDTDLLKLKISEIEKKLTGEKNLLKEYEEESYIASIEEEIKQLTNQKTSVQSQLDNIKVMMAANEEKINSLAEELKKEEALLSEQKLSLTSPFIEHLQMKLADLSNKISAASVEYSEKHPEMVMLKNQYDDTSRRIEEELETIITSQVKPSNTFYEQLRQTLINMAIEKNSLKASETSYLAVLKQLNQRLVKLPSIKSELQRLSSNIEHYKGVYDQLVLDMQELEIQTERNIQYVVVVDEAKPPAKPAFPILWLNVLVALISSLILGISCALMIDYFEDTRTVRTRKIIKAILSE